MVLAAASSRFCERDCGQSLSGRGRASALIIWRWKNMVGTYLISSNDVFAWSARSCETVKQIYILCFVHKAVETSPFLDSMVIADGYGA